ncbi:MAG: hypothetical protein WC393_05730 [Candidatus Nanoarchaeia archaeon]|jgi:transcription initiation factor TFIIB
MALEFLVQDDSIITLANSVLKNNKELMEYFFKQIRVYEEKLKKDGYPFSFVKYLESIDVNKESYESILSKLEKTNYFFQSNYLQTFSKLPAINKILIEKMVNSNYKNAEEINRAIEKLLSFEAKTQKYDDSEHSNSCGNCGGLEFMINDNECWVCTSCGLEYEKYYESTSQTDGKRAYNMQEINNRVTHEPRWRNFGPRTVIGEISNDVPAKKKAQFNRLKKIQGSLIGSLERNYWEALPKLNVMINKLSLSNNIQETATKIYKEAARQKLTMGRSIDAFVAGSVYAAIRIQNSPRWLEEIVSVSQLPTKSVSRSLSLIVAKVLPKFDYKYKQLSPFVLVPRFVQELNIDFKYSTNAMNLLKTAVHNGMRKMGKDPKGLAAAAIYLTLKYTNYKLTQVEIAGVSDITEVTLRTRAKEIKKYLK